MEFVLGILGVIFSGIILIMTIVMGIAPFVLPIIFWTYIIKTIQNSVQRTSSHKYFKSNIVDINYSDNKYIDVSKKKLEIFNTDDIGALKNYFSDIFVRFETAYNNLDYSTMKMLSTKQLFHNYYTGITLDLKVGKKRIIDDIKVKKVIIYELDSTVSKQTASTMIEISYFNYVIDGNGYIISGNREEKITEKFEVTFRKDFENNAVTRCRNCGANLTSHKCDYCKSIIKEEEFKISNIKRIIE